MANINSIYIKPQSVLLYVFMGILLILGGFRWDVGVDWDMYNNIYSGIRLHMNDIERHELFNVLISKELKSVGLIDGRYWIWTMLAISLSFIAFNIQKYSLNYLISILVFICFGYYFEMLNGIRQFAAVGISLCSWQFIISRSPVRFTTTILLASLFHTSALMVLPAYLIANQHFSKNTLKLMLIVSLFVAPLSTIFAPKIITFFPSYEVYSDSSALKYATGSGNVLSYLRIIFPLVIGIIIIKFRNALYRDSISTVISNMVFLGICIAVSFPTTMLMIRATYYFLIGYLLLIPLLYKILPRKHKNLIISCIILYQSLFIWITLLSRETSKILPFTLNFDLSIISVAHITIFTVILCFGLYKLLSLNFKL